jgi:hypothetical protein
MDPDPGCPKTCGSVSGSPTLVSENNYKVEQSMYGIVVYEPFPTDVSNFHGIDM